MKAKKYQLKNGLTVLLVHSHKSPVVSIQNWVRTGSADERKGEEGISHFIEHLVFKGTRSYKVGEIASTIEAAGGELNAYTSFDQTVFYVTISKEFKEVGLHAISEMMGFPLFDSQEIDNEREVVIEEIKRGLDSPSRKASQLLFSTAYPRHPYGIPVIGYDRVIRKVSPKTLSQYFYSRYVPKNMFLTIVGDFEEKEMKSLVAKHFGQLLNKPVRKSRRPKLRPKKNGLTLKIDGSKFNENYLYLSTHIPGALHKDIAAIDLLSIILGGGDSSRLVKDLRIAAPIANSIGASTFTPKDTGLFVISATVKQENLKALLAGIENNLIRLLTETVTNDELDRAKTNIESDQYYSIETVDGLARRLGNMEFLAKDPKFFGKYLKSIEQTSPLDLHRVAKKYLGHSAWIITAVANTKSTAAFKKTLDTWGKGLARRLSKKTASRVKTNRLKPKKRKLWKMDLAHDRNIKTEKLVLENGTTLLLRQSKDTPVISVKAAFLGGLRAETAEEQSLTELLSRTWISGTTQLSETDIYASLDAMAAQISAFSGRNTFGLSLDALTFQQQQAGQLFADLLTDSLWSEEILTREKSILLNQIQNRNDSPAQLCILKFQEMVFGNHPYGKDLWGTAESVKKISRNAIMRFFERLANPKNLSVCLTGNIDKDFWIKLLQNKTSALKCGERFATNFACKGNSKEAVFFQKLEREQSHIIIGFPGLTLNDEDRYALDIIQSVLAGQGGRLFLELRDRHSLAYSVAPIRMDGVDAGYFGAYIGCSPEKGSKALSMLKEQFELLVASEISLAELERAKRYLVGRHDIDLQQTSAVCSSILFSDIYGINFDEPFLCKDRYFKVTAQDIQRVAKKILTAPPIVSIVGPTFGE